MLITAIKKEKQKYFEEGAKSKEIQIARKLLQMGISVEKVNQSTNLPIEKILELQQ